MSQEPTAIIDNSGDFGPSENEGTTVKPDNVEGSAEPMEVTHYYTPADTHSTPESEPTLITPKTATVGEQMEPDQDANVTDGNKQPPEDRPTDNAHSKRNQKQRYQDQNKRLKEENERLKEQLQSVLIDQAVYEEKIKELQSEVKLRKDLYEHQLLEQTKDKDSKSKEEELISENDKLKKVIQDLKKQCGQYEIREKEVNDEIGKLKKEKKEKEAETKGLKKKFQETEKELKHDTEQLKKDKKKLEKEIQDWKKDVGTLSNTKINLEQKLSNVQDELKDVQETFKVQIAEYNKQYHENRETIRNLSSNNVQLKAEWKRTTEAYNSLWRQNEVQLETLKNIRDEKSKLEAEKQNLLLRLSKLAGANLTYNNPNIADLSDEKRPTKLAEEFSELYDNEWTDAFEDVEYADEKEKAAFLLKLLQRVHELCHEASCEHFESIRSCFSTITLRTKPERGQKKSTPDVIESKKTDAAEPGKNDNVIPDVTKQRQDSLKTETAEPGTNDNVIPDVTEQGQDSLKAKELRGPSSCDHDNQFERTGDMMDKEFSQNYENDLKLEENPGEGQYSQKDHKPEERKKMELKVSTTATSSIEEAGGPTSESGAQEDIDKTIEKEYDTNANENGGTKYEEDENVSMSPGKKELSDKQGNRGDGTVTTVAMQQTPIEKLKENNAAQAQTLDGAEPGKIDNDTTNKLEKKEGGQTSDALQIWTNSNADTEQKEDDKKANDLSETSSCDNGDQTERTDETKDETSSQNNGNTKTKKCDKEVLLSSENNTDKTENHNTDGETVALADEEMEEMTSLRPEGKKILSDFKLLSNEQKKIITEARNFFENELSKEVEMAGTELILQENMIDQQKQQSIKIYIEKCINICWSMCRHEPPVHVEFLEILDDVPFDTNKYKPYTKSGKHLDYIVWPVLYLHEDGPMLSKGVAQGK